MFNVYENYHFFTYKDLTFIIKEVDGEKVRSKDADFVGAGNPLIYKWMPKNEIWVEKSFSIFEKNVFVIHEIVEFLLLKYKKMDYYHAHDMANQFEQRLRNNENIMVVSREFVVGMNLDPKLIFSIVEFYRRYSLGRK
jgi:hypothetical protein